MFALILGSRVRERGVDQNMASRRRDEPGTDAGETDIINVADDAVWRQGRLPGFKKLPRRREILGDRARKIGCGGGRWLSSVGLGETHGTTARETKIQKRNPAKFSEIVVINSCNHSARSQTSKTKQAGLPQAATEFPWGGARRSARAGMAHQIKFAPP